jgi:hypothetical protein
MNFVDYRNIHEMLMATVDRSGDNPAYRTILEGGDFASVTWA